MTAGGSTYMPLRVNMAGVIPIIFAAAVMAFPPTIGQYFPQTQSFVNAHFSPTNLTYLLLEAVLIIIFTYFYTAVQFNPVDQADNLRKHGGYIPGIRPGPPTAQYLDRVLTRLTLPGCALPRDRRRPAEHLHPLLRLLAGDLARSRRHLGADRGRRRARHDAADGVADDDALLRGLPEVACRSTCSSSASRGPARERRRSGIAAEYGLAHIATGDMLRAAIADGSAARRARAADPRERRARPRRPDDRADPGAAPVRRRRGRVRPRRLPAHDGPGGRARRDAGRDRTGRCHVVFELQVPDEVAVERLRKRGRRGGPRRRHARGDRQAARALPPRDEAARRALSARGNLVGIHGDRPENEVFAEIQQALDQARVAS